ncbi:lysophospholipid acyltransferase family protein [Parabacteroides sp. PF5-9]|uniref:lysophospholipid acyltransferase family protein n=1 Tax=Parabacteroides sp. PF5-9 TaxID=1742404 RepID=UPI002473E8E7|nr:lysophospholipid acyltransferase family protein [Parabacteroides sp. PF5-9]MDH6357671.1 1-acyl-sn-glycerol-3-phosphate acyltransferase [Parabacteroides sp. PF5-9]
MTRILYILYLWLVAVPVFLILTVITALTVIIGCLLGGEKIFSYYPGMIWSRITCYLTLCPVDMRGREYIDRKKSYVFVANHQGAFDIFLIYGFLGVPIKWVMKAGIGKIPLVGTACRAAGFIFVDNSTPKAALQSVTAAERSLKNGASVAVFPEGSRTYDGKMIRFKKGAYQMAVDQHLPVVPITLNGPFYVLPIGSLNIKRHRMEMVIHPPLSTDHIETSNKGLQKLADETQQIIASGLWDDFK